MSVIARVFEFESHELRTTSIDNQPHLVIADVCRILGLSNPSMAAKSIDEDDLSDAEVIDSMGRKQTVKVCNESGFYQLVFQSRKPEAKNFRRWVTREVLPAIRETGRYEMDRVAPSFPVPQSYPEALRLAADQHELIERQRTQLTAASAKADYVDTFLRSSDTCLVRQLAKHIGMTEAELRDELMNRKVIFRTPIGRFSKSKKKQVIEYRYEPCTKYMTWFREGDQPTAPRHHNGQMRTTLYVTPIGKVGIARLLARLGSSPLAIEGTAA